MTEVIMYAENGVSPVLEWMAELDEKVQEKLRRLVLMLEQDGHLLRRPIADILRDGVYEMRTRHGNVNFRLLYVFHGRGIAIVAHGCTKERRVKPKEIDLAIIRYQRFAANPTAHTFSNRNDP